MIYIRRSLQKVFKIFFQILFKTIYGKVKYNSENFKNNIILKSILNFLFDQKLIQPYL